MKNFKMAPWQLSWQLEGMVLAILNLCVTNASPQVLAQSNLRFGRRCRLKNFKMATMAAILIIGTERF